MNCLLLFVSVAAFQLICWCTVATLDSWHSAGTLFFRTLNDILYSNFVFLYVQWKPLIMITLGPVLFDNNNRLITLSRGYKNLHYLTQFIVTTFCMYFYSVCSAL
jgi:hypothetical protein